MSQGHQVSERMRLIRWRMTKESFRFADEIRLIPRWLVVLVVALYVVAQVAAQVIIGVVKGDRLWPELSPGLNALGLAGLITLVAGPVAFLLFLFAYINRDAKRREMNSTLWTLIAIFVPYFIGLFIYFLVREPLPFACPQCGATTSARFNYCPSCKFNLRPACPQCKREIRLGDRYCPHCAYELGEAVQEKSTPPAANS